MSPKAERIASVKKQIRGYEKELSSNKQIAEDLLKRNRTINHELTTLKHQLSNLSPKDLKVSDHAVVRYLERKHGIDIDAVTKEMVEGIGGTNVGNAKVNGFVVSNNVVVTYYKKENQDG